MRNRLKLGAILAAATVAVALGGCAAEPNSAGDHGGGSSSDEQPGTGDKPGSETPDNDSGEPNLADLDHDAVLAIGLEGGAAITCVYTFDSEELDGLRMLSPTGWTTPEATIHVYDTSAHWEIPQEDGRLSHILYYEGATYTWKVPGNGGGAKTDAGEDTSLGVLAARMQKNAHDCVAFTGPASMFTVPTDLEFKRFEDLLH